MKVREFRELVRKVYPHVKLTVRAGTAYLANERSAGERSTINQWAAAAGLSPESRVYVYAGGKRV